MNTRSTIWLINQYASTPESGAGGRSYYMACELANLGYNVYLIGSSNNHLLRRPPRVANKFRIEKVEGFSFVWVKVPKYKTASSKIRVFNWFLFSWRLRQLKKVISDSPNAILYSSPSLPGFLGAKNLADYYGASLVFDVRDIWPLTLCQLGGYSPNHPFIRLCQWIEDKAYRDADRVTSNLRNAVEHMVFRGMDREKFVWIPNGFYREEVANTKQLTPDVCSKLPTGKFVIGYTGTLGVANALDNLIDAAAQLKAVDQLAFVLVGGGGEKRKLQQLVESRGLSNVVFIDPIHKAQVQAMLGHFDICYIGLTKDPLFRFGVSPNKLFDYLYAGKPIIYAIDSGLYRPVEEFGAGVQVPPEDSGALAEAIMTLFRLSQEERDAMGARGHKQVLAQHEYGQLAKQVASVLFNDCADG